MFFEFLHTFSRTLFITLLSVYIMFRFHIKDTTQRILELGSLTLHF